MHATRNAAALLVATVLLFGCSNSSNTSAQSSPSPGGAAASTNAATTASASAPTATPQTGTSSDAQSGLAKPDGNAVRPFDGGMLVGGYAAQSGSTPTQGDAVAYAAMSTQTNLDCDTVKRDFGTDFATHRNADPYLQKLKTRARPMGYASIDLQTYIGAYDFNAKAFQIGSGYGDGVKTFTFNWYSNCGEGGQMPDGSYAYSSVTLEADNTDGFLHAYPLPTDQAEAFQNTKGQYNFTEHLVFYPVAIARTQGNQLGAVVHVTKVVLLEKSVYGADTSPPKVLMSRDIP
jgi:hypothetical protein